ncbi:DUF6327 family protein [Leeuwenhoekiella aequorea]|uniref:DUF6327 family protein n=1 Tax=Leeuwenhoekiella TaxID=283735 RepID=UPI00352F97BD|tara:strand:+ start:355 stop:600 length:246 start_codon:yes stop_codon:yes gene_type:complete
MKVYKSFLEIEHDLKVLKLQNQIDREQVKLSINDVKSSFSPMSMVANTVGAIAQKTIVLKAVNSILGIRRVKVKNVEGENE